MNRLNKTGSPISVILFVICFQREPFRFLFYFTAGRVVAAVKSFPIRHHNADYIFISFGITELFLISLKIEYRLGRGKQVCVRVLVGGGGGGGGGRGGCE